MVVTSAALQPARMFVAPAVKLIIAGTRPADISPRIVTTAPLAFGSITPIGAPFGRERHQLGAEDRRAGQQPLVGHRAGDGILDRDAVLAVRSAASTTAWIIVLSVEVVRNTRSDMMP